MSILNEFNNLLEKEKWAQDVKVKKGKMHKLLNVPDDKKISDVFKSGKALALKLLKANKDDEKKTSSMLAFAANVDKEDTVLDKALRYMKQVNKEFAKRM
tara:strand:+ start:44230 stop:44529 length:300 start_codon:yes stop_codon:yes gene_type:complete